MTRGRANPRHWQFPSRLRRARKAAGLSCAGLSRLAGLGQYTVAAIEAGHRLPRLPAAEKLARVLGMAPGELAYGLVTPSDPAAGDALRCAGLGERAREVREERGLSMREVGRRLGSSAGTVQALERDTMPTLDTLEDLSVALGVSPSWLAFSEGPIELPRRGSAKLAGAPA